MVVSSSVNCRSLFNLLQNCLSSPDTVDCIIGLISSPVTCTQFLCHVTWQFLPRHASSPLGFSHVACFGLGDVRWCDSSRGCGPAFSHFCHRHRKNPHTDPEVWAPWVIHSTRGADLSPACSKELRPVGPTARSRAGPAVTAWRKAAQPPGKVVGDNEAPLVPRHWGAVVGLCRKS